LKIKHLRNTDINTLKWDECINTAFNGIVYAYSWYLDIVCEDWEALVEGDYETVMPLTINRKFTIWYIYQPYFTQQLGVFSKVKLSEKKVAEFINAIPAKYKYIDINLNTFNKLIDNQFKKEERVTYQLDLIQPYSVIAEKYSTNTRRNIKKAIENKISIINSVTINSLIDFFKQNIGNKLQMKESSYENLRRIISFAQRYRTGEILGAYTEQNELCAAAFFLTSHNKTIFLVSVSNDSGKENRAMFLLVDQFIKKFSEKNLTLDFEGSNIESIARFYESFGAKPCKYLRITQNRLPWYARIFKKQKSFLKFFSLKN